MCKECTHDELTKETKKLYNKVSTDLNFVEREKNVVEFWKKNDIFK